jgi:hypothetical protein
VPCSGPFPANRYTSYMTSSTSVDLSLAHRELVILGECDAWLCDASDAGIPVWQAWRASARTAHLLLPGLMQPPRASLPLTAHCAACHPGAPTRPHRCCCAPTGLDHTTAYPAVPPPPPPVTNTCRHPVCGGDEEGRLHHHALPHAQARHPVAALGLQRGRRERRHALLWPERWVRDTRCAVCGVRCVCMLWARGGTCMAPCL